VGALTNTQRQLLASLAARIVPESASIAGSPRAEINPYVTIMALADRVAERVRREWPHLRANAS
jgi:hypothetical protein